MISQKVSKIFIAAIIIYQPWTATSEFMYNVTQEKPLRDLAAKWF